jgi:hypothetical protein
MAAKSSARPMKRHIDFEEFLYVWGYISFSFDRGQLKPERLGSEDWNLGPRWNIEHFGVR